MICLSIKFIQAPLCVEGWDEALHEIGRLSHETILPPQCEAALLKAVEDLPVLVIAGAEDALVSLKSSQVMASKLVNSVSVSHLISSYYIIKILVLFLMKLSYIVVLLKQLSSPKW